MANKKDDDFDLPRHSKHLHHRQASSAASFSSALPSRHVPRRSVFFRFVIYLVFIVALIYLLNHGIGLSSDESSSSSSPAQARSRSPPPPPHEEVPIPPPRPNEHDDGAWTNHGEKSHEGKAQSESQPKAKPKLQEQIVEPVEPKSEPKPAGNKAKAPEDSPPDAHHHHEAPKIGLEPAQSQSQAQAQAQSYSSYKGPLRFSQLASSLSSKLASSARYQPHRNVLFAAGSLKSAATLLPMACQMVGEGLNIVNFALMSRDGILMDDLLKINGVDETCQAKLLIHDARPDHAAKSSNSRMALATARGLYHINRFITLKTIIVDGSNAEEDYFLSGLRDEIRTLEAGLIELPSRAGSRFSWLTKLDATALAAWNDVQIDILIHASPRGVGNLKRLLSSLARADLDGMTPPHLTIELPPVINPNLARFLEEYRWPSSSSHSGSFSQMLSLRHRIPRDRMNEEEASARFLESFWTSRPYYHHVLILSPHTEVSRQFFHYLKYSLLQYRYSLAALRGQWQDRLLGFSFSAPQTHLDDVTKFVPPPAQRESKTDDDSPRPPILWQSPSSDAMLILGDKWVELHGYASQYLQRQQQAAGKSSAPLLDKEVSKNHPAWLEYVLQLSRLRGYLTIHPGPETADVVMGVHRDLFDAPEEYEGEEGMVKEGETISRQAAETFDAGSRVDMLETLPNKGQLPPLHSLAWLSWDGKLSAADEIKKQAKEYRRAFRERVGQCSGAEAAKNVAAAADANDLFCAAT